MHFCIFNHRLSHQLEGLHYLVLRLPARTFSGLVREAASTTVSLYPPSGAAWFWPLLFSSTRFISTPWIFDFYGFSAVSDLESYLKDPLCSWGYFSPSMSPMFLDGVPKWSANFLNRLWRKIAPLFCKISSRISALASGSLNVLPLVW